MAMRDVARWEMGPPTGGPRRPTEAHPPPEVGVSAAVACAAVDTRLENASPCSASLPNGRSYHNAHLPTSIL